LAEANVTATFMQERAKWNQPHDNWSKVSTILRFMQHERSKFYWHGLYLCTP